MSRWMFGWISHNICWLSLSIPYTECFELNVTATSGGFVRDSATNFNDKIAFVYYSKIKDSTRIAWEDNSRRVINVNVQMITTVSIYTGISLNLPMVFLLILFNTDNNML